MKRKKHLPEKGLSLIEILVVITLLGGLIVSLYPPIISQIRKARDARRKIDFNLIANSLNQNYDSTGCFPKSISQCNQPLILNEIQYLSPIPCDPKTKTSYVYLSDGNNCSNWFKLYTNLERREDINIDLVGCRSGCGPSCQYNFGVSSPNIGLDYCLPPVSPTSTPIPVPTSSPLPTATPQPPTPTPILYACSPASGPMPEGQCESYDDPILSECPKVYPNDPTCANECQFQENRCANNRGKNKPD